MSTLQLDLFGGQPTVAGDVIARIVYVLETYPDTRNNYKRLMARYWLAFDGLGDVLPTAAQQETFVRWFAGRKATSPKTLQNRCMEIQNSRPDLEAEADIEQKRQKQARAGVVK